MAAISLAPALRFDSLPGLPREIILDVPVLRQMNWASCGLASVNMAMRFHGLVVSEPALEKHTLVGERYLCRYGFGPGRLGRIALSFGFDVTMIDPVPRDVGTRFAAEGGRWVRRSPGRDDILRALREGLPSVVCIPDTSEAFGGTRHGSHWVIVRGVSRGEFLIHDPAPWRRARRCAPGYWRDWNCSMMVIGKRDFSGRR